MPDPRAMRFADDGAIPNHPRFPALVYTGIAEAADGAAACEALFAANVWAPQWRAGVYPFHHFHSTAHEALGVVSGTAELMLGGPAGERLTVRAGDVLVLPAGTGHRRLTDSSGFLVVGAYPPGQDWDLRRGDPAEHDEAVRNIARVPLPSSDPVGGRDGALVRLWTG
jgi:uncharacterized protein YjlB